MMAALSELLQPELLDWAEDVENEIQHMAPLQRSFSKSPDSPQWDDTLDTVQDTEHQHSRPTSRRDHYDLSDFDQTGDAEMVEYITETQILDMNNVNTATTPSSTTKDRPVIVNGSTTKEVYPQEGSAAAWDSMVEDVHNVFGWRHHCVDTEEEIHHFNWFGEPVYQQSATSPSESLAVILADPKVPEVKEDYRVYSILRRAYTFLDPVLVNLDIAADNLMMLRGSRLQLASAGRVFKYYTPHGQWMTQETEDFEQIAVDDGNIDTYLTTDRAVGNGFTQHSVVPSRTEWIKVRDDKVASLSPRRPPRKLSWQPKSSPLRQTTSVSDTQPKLKTKRAAQELRVIVFPKSIGAVQSSSRRPTPFTDSQSTDSSRDSNTLFSFPLPKFPKRERRKCLRRALKRTWRKLLSVLSFGESHYP